MLMLSCKADVPCTYVELILSCELRPIFLMQCAMRLSLYAMLSSDAWLTLQLLYTLNFAWFVTRSCY